MAAAWQNASRLNRWWRARTYHWPLPVSGAIAADLDAPASAYNCFAEARLGPLVQCSRQATLARHFIPIWFFLRFTDFRTIRIVFASDS